MILDIARFEIADPPCTDSPKTSEACSSCKYNSDNNVENKLKPFGEIASNDERKGRVCWSGFVYERGVSYRVGDAVFITPPSNNNLEQEVDRHLTKQVDETIYPEHYRKTKYVKVIT